MNKPDKSRLSALLAATAIFAAWGSPHLAQAQDAVEPTKRPSIAIESVVVVDVVRGETVGPRTVLIVDGRIAAIGVPGTIDIPSAAARVDGRGRYLMPGLVDMHVHLFNNASRRAPNEWAFPLFVANGVTAVREMRTEPAQMAVVKGWRAKVDRGELIAPSLVAVGVAAGTGTVEETRRQVREAKAAGADFVKVFSEVREPQWRALLEAAHALQMPVCGHIPGEVSLLDGATAGQRSNEHLTQVYEACSAREKQWLGARTGLDGPKIVELRDAQEQEVLESFEPLVCDRIAAALARTDQVQVPTLVLPYFEARGSPTTFRDDPRWRYLRPDEQARWQRFLKIREHAVEDQKLAARRCGRPPLGGFPSNRQVAAGGRGALAGRDRCAHAARLSGIRAAQRTGVARRGRAESSRCAARRHHLAGRVSRSERPQRLNRRG